MSKLSTSSPKIKSEMLSLMKRRYQVLIPDTNLEIKAYKDLQQDFVLESIAYLYGYKQTGSTIIEDKEYLDIYEHFRDKILSKYKLTRLLFCSTPIRYKTSLRNIEVESITFYPEIPKILKEYKYYFTEHNIASCTSELDSKHAFNS